MGERDENELQEHRCGFADGIAIVIAHFIYFGIFPNKNAIEIRGTALQGQRVTP